MKHDHLNLITTEVEARSKGDRTANIASYEKVHEQILHTEDMPSAGILSQFPKKFAQPVTRNPATGFAALRRKNPDRHFRDRLTVPPRIILV